MARARHDANLRHVQYGCGWDAPAAWVNFDASPTLRVERLPLTKRIYVKNREPFPPNVRFGDIVDGLPIRTGTCELLYCSHVLEHLPLEDFLAAVTNSWKVLAPGGIWRMVVPDLKAEVMKYLSSGRRDAAETFMLDTGLGLRRRPHRLADRITYALGHSRHLWMWDFESLAERLESAGFSQIRRAQLGDAEHPAFAQVERPERWEGALGVECRKRR